MYTDEMNVPSDTRGKSSELYEFVFHIGMWWRIVYGFLRLIAGGVLFRLVGTPVSDVFYMFMRHEIIDDPNDALIRALHPLLRHLPFTITYFIATYLVFWGIVDIFLSINLLKHNLWAYPISICLIGVFVAYEMYRVTRTHSVVLVGIIIIDMVLLWLISGEYRKLRSLKYVSKNAPLPRG